ncbi:hypothetical protein HZ992_18950 [Rhizobacter sp. AJA081-3]|uniref:helix-turn-helix domain-containing protein n=1 Tax=Rhizobacter sp. AJA081-3 TaxID=2753607 RepID=UPI001AE04046|nr:hypothetical protein [Rhizobacter sp. AJA081-3]QTN22219.1 hypothetical protein HZ992_18950 [Rhizobacter sp. AJA081-3]
MPNIASVLKSEIARLARKELRTATDGLKKTLAAHRTELVALKRQVRDLEKLLKTVSRGRTPSAKAKTAEKGNAEESGGRVRFSAKGLATNRRRLGLSAADFGLLVGASGQSIYHWEAGKAQPRTTSLSAIVELRGIGKKEAAARLAELKSAR